MATHSSILVSGAEGRDGEERGGGGVRSGPGWGVGIGVGAAVGNLDRGGKLQSMKMQRVGHNRATKHKHKRYYYSYYQLNPCSATYSFSKALSTCFPGCNIW